MNKRYIGTESNGEMVFQKIGENGLIRGFDLAYPAELVSGDMVLSVSEWCHKVIIDGLTLETGMAAASVIPMPKDLADAYMTDTVSCEECSAIHASDDSVGNSSDPTWTVVDECTTVCLGCRTPEQCLTRLDSVEDFFKSKLVEGVSLKGFVEVETLFCDSSGFGSSNEPAMTKAQAKAKVTGLMTKHGELFSGVTNAGQFQVYVTLYRRRKSSKRKAA